jgi:hypothetical protein
VPAGTVATARDQPDYHYLVEVLQSGANFCLVAEP